MGSTPRIKNISEMRYNELLDFPRSMHCSSSSKSFISRKEGQKIILFFAFFSTRYFIVLQTVKVGGRRFSTSFRSLFSCSQRNLVPFGSNWNRAKTIPDRTEIHSEELRNDFQPQSGRKISILGKLFVEIDSN